MMAGFCVITEELRRVIVTYSVEADDAAHAAEKVRDNMGDCDEIDYDFVSTVELVDISRVEET